MRKLYWSLIVLWLALLTATQYRVIEIQHLQNEVLRSMVGDITSLQLNAIFEQKRIEKLQRQQKKGLPLQEQ